MKNLRNILNKTAVANLVHYRGLMKERENGSQFGLRPRRSKLLQLSFKRVPNPTHVVGGKTVSVNADMMSFCIYWRADISAVFPNATKQILTGKTLTSDVVVTVAAGGHTDIRNPEGKYLVTTSAAPVVPTSELILIEGPAEDVNNSPIPGTMVWTWIIGGLTTNIDFDWINSKKVGEIINHSEIDDNWAIKTV